MTRDNDPDDDRDDGDDRTDRDPRGGLFENLLDLVKALDDLDDDRTSGSGRVDGKRSSIDFDYDIRVGISGDRDGGHEPDPDRQPATAIDATDARSAPEAGVSVYDVAEYGDETVVTADLPGATQAEVGFSLGDDGTTLVIERDGEAVERIPLDRPASRATDARFTNQVLTVHLAPGDENGDGTDRHDDADEGDETDAAGTTDGEEGTDD